MHAAGAGCNEIHFKPVFFAIPQLDMLVSVTGAEEIDPTPVEVHPLGSILTHRAENPPSCPAAHTGLASTAELWPCW